MGKTVEHYESMDAFIKANPTYRTHDFRFTLTQTWDEAMTLNGKVCHVICNAYIENIKRYVIIYDTDILETISERFIQMNHEQYRGTDTDC